MAQWSEARSEAKKGLHGAKQSLLRCLLRLETFFTIRMNTPGYSHSKPECEHVCYNVGEGLGW